MCRKGFQGPTRVQVGDADIQLAACNGPPCPHQLIFQVTPLSGRQWGVVLQMSLPVILLDEALKYLSRNHMDEKRDLK